ncbi:MAG: hypothetical protein LBU72_01370 [Burkholderiaceae bacterium]|jgi:uncharacterized protein|nr:hypothetical protein [Burkholderiaceae bacterium]
MKALLVLLAVAAAVWLWRRGQRVSAARARRPSVGAPQPMLRCARCGVHLPASSALRGREGRAYCCPAHRQQAEGG